MDLIIKEHKFSFRAVYDIQVAGRIYSARGKFFSFLPSLKVLDQNSQPVASIQGRWSPFRKKYVFELSDGRAYEFSREKIVKGVYLCRGKDERFRMYRHKGLNYSIFQNDVQIAAFSKNRIVIGKGNEYHVRLNTNANELAVLCMVLALNSNEDGDDETVNIDLGSFGPEERPFDASWQPN